MNILITGAAGYIGSHVAKQLLLETTYNITILDNLSTGDIKTISILQNIRKFNFIKLDLKDFSQIENFIKENKFDLIMHFAASVIVSESIIDPLKYYTNNTANTTNLIKCASKYKVNKFIFSSTAAVYGDPTLNEKEIKTGINEEYDTNPINPYGMSKLMSEIIIKDEAKSNETFKYIIFRYFNVAGADINYEKSKLVPRIGQHSINSTHLIKVASQCSLGKIDKMYIFGDNYNTKDGTCIRDYIHVDDLASAHIKAISHFENNKNEIFNIGYGVGFSVQEVIKCMKDTSKSEFEIEINQRRKGDPSIIFADNSKIKNNLKWNPKYDNLELICESTLEWERLND